MDVLKEIQQFIIVPREASEEVQEIRWNENNTRILIDLYSKYKPKVGTIKIKTIKSMWQIIAEELHSLLGVVVTPGHCENRWKVLDRNYKKYVDNINSTGRGKKYFEYYEDMQVIFAKKKNVCPEVLLSSQTIHVPETVQTEENLEETGEPEVENIEPIVTITPRRKENVYKKLSVLEKIRQDRLQYYNRKLEIEEEKLRLLREKNELIKERNKTLKESCKCQCQSSQNC